MFNFGRKPDLNRETAENQAQLPWIFLDSSSFSEY